MKINKTIGFIFLVLSLAEGCKNNDSGFYTGLSRVPGTEVASPTSSIKKDYVLVANKNATGKNISVVSVRPFRDFSLANACGLGFSQCDTNSYTYKDEFSLSFVAGYDVEEMVLAGRDLITLNGDESLTVTDISHLLSPTMQGPPVQPSSSTVTLNYCRGARSLTVTPDNQMVLVACQYSNNIMLIENNGIDTAADSILPPIQLQDAQSISFSPLSVAVSSDGRMALASCYRGRFGLLVPIDLVKRKMLEPVSVPFIPRKSIFTPQTDAVLIGSGTRLRSIGFRSLQADRMFPYFNETSTGPITISDFALSRNGNYGAAISEFNQSIQVIKSSLNGVPYDLGYGSFGDYKNESVIDVGMDDFYSVVDEKFLNYPPTNVAVGLGGKVAVVTMAEGHQIAMVQLVNSAKPPVHINVGASPVAAVFTRP